MIGQDPLPDHFYEGTVIRLDDRNLRDRDSNRKQDRERDDAQNRGIRFRIHGYRHFTRKMRHKLAFLFAVVVLLFSILVIRIVRINADNGDAYKRQVLMQQSYDSQAIPFKRGTISDARGTVLATSTLVYNVILDAKQVREQDAYLEPTLNAVQQVFGNDVSELRTYINDHPDSQYYVLDKLIDPSKKKEFDDLVAAQDKGVDNIQGIWFEDAYIRNYPNDALASNVIGFAGSTNKGSYGLEQYYNDTLNGKPGRSYGYIGDNSDVEKTTIPATDGDSLVLTLDANIQSIVEKYLQKFNDEHKDEVREGNGARNIGCIIMDCNTGGILAMADYPNYNLNDPNNTAPLVGMTKLDFTNNDSPMEDAYLTQADVDALTDEEKSKYLNALWKNFCISDYYEPGSVIKPFTVAAGLESGSFSPTQSYNCTGSLSIGGYDIKCHNTFGDGTLTVSQAIERSCNVCLMQMAMAEGVDTFCKFQNIFNFGLKTNIDLANEARTDSMIYSPGKMQTVDLATNSFGQNFDVTMIQVAAGFCSLINGGNYYQPHLVSRITSASGATIQTIDPEVIKKTISADTSDWIKSYCEQVVVGDHGTGKTARPAGYLIGGKTGTAETLPRRNGQYVVSFMGYAPADNPKIVCYVVVDRPNASPQDNAKFATGIFRNILTEVLPYLNIPMTEPLSDDEKAELQQLQESGTIALGANAMAALDSSANAASGESSADGSSVETANSGDSSSTAEAAGDGSSTSTSGDATSGESAQESWKSFPKDETTGYLVDPSTGMYVDPDTGHEFDVGPATSGTTAAGATGDGTSAAAPAGTSGDGTSAAAPAAGTGDGVPAEVPGDTAAAGDNAGAAAQ